MYYMSLQNDVNKLLTNFLIDYNNLSLSKLQIISLPIKSPELSYKDTDYYYNLIIPSLFTIGGIAILFKFVLWFVSEKEKKLKDLVMRQGITNFQYIMSWLITFIILNFIPVLVYALVLNVFFFKHTNYFFVLIPCILFFLNIFAMGIAMSQVLNNVNQSQSLLKLIYVGITILGVPLSLETTSAPIRYIFSIFPQIVLKSVFEMLWQSKVIFLILTFSNILMDWISLFFLKRIKTSISFRC